METKRIILSGGGTGGHIYPAISIANEILFRDKNTEILFVGAKNKMEMNIVPKYGFSILGLWISGINRNNFLKNILVPVKLVISIFQSLLIIKRFSPNIVIGTGGYASGPILYVANLLKIPTLIQEQNSYPGITNKLLSKKVNTVCVAYNYLDKYFPKDKIKLTGNPVRSSITEYSDSFEIKKSKRRKNEINIKLGLRQWDESFYGIGCEIKVYQRIQILLQDLHSAKLLLSFLLNLLLLLNQLRIL